MQYLVNSFADKAKSLPLQNGWVRYCHSRTYGCLTFFFKTTNHLNAEKIPHAHMKSASAGEVKITTVDFILFFRCQDEQSWPSHTRALWPEEFISYLL